MANPDLEPSESNSNSDTKISNPKTFPEFLWLLIATKQGWTGVSVLFGVLSLAVCITTGLVILIIPPENKFDVETTFGRLTFTAGGKKNTVLLLSPNGGDKNTPWVRTGIKVKEKEEIKITASGRINTAMRTIVTQAIRPGIDDPTWVGPSGLKESKRFSPFKLYEQKKLQPPILSKDGKKYDRYNGFGMLLATVEDCPQDVKLESIHSFPEDDNKPLEFKAEKDGELLLTVNDIWLGREQEDVYVPKFEGKENIDYYVQLAEAEATFKEDVDSWTEEIKLKKAKEQHSKRKEDWKDIKLNGNWNVWYDDNIGAFSVSIVIN